jgi:hypothetical protein
MHYGIPFLISYIALWSLALVLCIAVILLYRYFGGQLLLRNSNLEGAGPKLDSQIRLTFKTVDGSAYTVGPGSDRPHLICFVAPRSLECDRATSVVSDFIRTHGTIGLVVIYNDGEANARSYASKLVESSIVVSDVNRDLAKLWNVPKSPYFVLLDVQGVIKGKSHLTTARGLHPLFDIARRT